MVVRPKLYKSGKFLKRLPIKQQVIYSPNNKESVVYRGRVYELFDDAIDIAKESFSLGECQTSSHSLDSIDKYTIERRSFKTLVFLETSLNKFNSFLYELDLANIPYIQSGISSQSSETSQNQNEKYYIRFSNEFVEATDDFDKKIHISFKNALQGSYKKSAIKEIGKIIASKNETNKKENVLNYINNISLIGLTDLVIDLYETTSKELVENIKIKKKSNDLNQKYLYQLDKIEFLEKEIKKQKNDDSFLKEISKKDKEILDLYEIIDEYETEINQLKTIKTSSEISNQQNKLISYLNGFLDTFTPNIELIGNSEVNFINKYTRFSEVLTLLRDLSKDIKSVVSKKIHTLSGWQEINRHISTGNEKKGRIYFKNLKEAQKILVYIDYKEDDKSQKRVFKYLNKLDLNKKLFF